MTTTGASATRTDDVAVLPTVSRLVLLGHPVAHSLSPRFQNAALDAAGLRQRYAALDVAPAELAPTIDALVAERAAGNATVPHKSAFAARCDVLTPIAARIGAVNTWWVAADGRLIGDNTDVGGFDCMARALLPRVDGARVALLGAGGAAAAVAATVERWPGATLHVWSRTAARARALASRHSAVAIACDDVQAVLRGATLVVNATPLGLRPADELPAPVDAIPRAAAVLDLAYAPERTAWVRALRAAGHLADDGLGMLIEQGALAFARWFGREPDRAAMWRAVGREAPSPLR